MLSWKKKEPTKRLVRVHHTNMDDKAIEAIWLGMVDGHYHLTAVKFVSSDGKEAVAGDYFIPAAKVLFLATVAVDDAV